MKPNFSTARSHFNHMFKLFPNELVMCYFDRTIINYWTKVEQNCRWLYADHDILY